MRQPADRRTPCRTRAPSPAPPGDGPRIRARRFPGARTCRTSGATILACALGLVAAVAAGGCATGYIPPSEAVTVKVDNRSEWDVTVGAVHHAGIRDFVERVERGEERTFRVSPRAFGDGPVAFELVTGRGRLQRRYGGDERVRVPPGSTVLVVLAPDLRHSMVQVRRDPDLAVSR